MAVREEYGSNQANVPSRSSDAHYAIVDQAFR